MRLKALLVTLLALMAALGLAQGQPTTGPRAKWSIQLGANDVRPGEAVNLLIRADLQAGWHIYQLGQTGGPSPLEIQLVPSLGLESAGDPIGPEPKKKFDESFKVEVGYHEGAAVFGLPVRISSDAKGSVRAQVQIKYQACDAVSCERPETVVLDLDIQVQAGETRTERIVASMDVPEQPEVQPDSGSSTASTEGKPKPPKRLADTLWGIFAVGFGAGLFALLTPCVFPMIPVTISFFTKQSGDDQKKLIRIAIIYCLGIIVSFTGLGLAVTLAIGANGTLVLANNVWVNLFLFLLFVFLAASLFGVFELVLPASFTTKVEGLGNKGGNVIAPLLMGLTFALTSFTCTVPVVGGLLAGVASGDTVFPTVGMLGFSSALALPFFLLAFFPTLLKKMPRAGGWMVTVKAFMGFLELAAAVKFLSNIDLVLDWYFLTRPVFLAIWFAIFVLAGIHLLGWIKLPHDAGGKIGWTRRIFALGTLGIAVLCLMAMNGTNSLGAAQGLLPPKDYMPAGSTLATVDKSANPWFKNDFEVALAKSKELNLPILIDFTGET